jgi:hypothetical protein
MINDKTIGLILYVFADFDCNYNGVLPSIYLNKLEITDQDLHELVQNGLIEPNIDQPMLDNYSLTTKGHQEIYRIWSSYKLEFPELLENILI